MIWKTIETETLLQNEYITVKKDKVKLPDGVMIDDFYTVRIQDAALVVALTIDGLVLLKSEYRYACGEEVIECPAGMVEDGEDPQNAAIRELYEETGYQSNHWLYLGPTWESTSKLTNTMHLFLARDCVQISAQHLDKNEHIELMRVPLFTAVDMVMKGKINANSSAHAILKAKCLLEGNSDGLQE